MTAESLKPPSDDLIAGRYRPRRVLGKGGMAVVWAVLDTVTGEEVALKRLLRGADTREGILFEREYRTLASLRHPRIVEVYDYGVDDQGGFYTMELLRGSDLTGMSPMPWPQVCSCLRDTASILGVLHARGLVYRDLNPRNLWRTPDGRIKLLDFGAMAPFGRAPEVVGAAPLVAPEAFEGGPLDQRTDLYSLGALGYWLVTSAHAFRAARLDDLPSAWQRTPARPSTLVELIANGEASDFPLALERLLLRLLMADPNERPSTTEDVIDALNGIAELESEAEAVVTQGYLQRSAFVGRAAEGQRFGELLERACDGHPQALLIDGSQGTGRSRLLEEFVTTARIRGAVTVKVACSAQGTSYAVASSLLAGLLQAAPEQAGHAIRPHAAVLGHLSEDLHSLLGGGPLDPTLAGAEDERLRLQLALQRAIESLSEARPLVLLVDDLGMADEESLAWLTALARASKGHPILVAATCMSSVLEDEHSPLGAFADRASTLRLAPFTSGEVHELLRSVFGQVRYLDRLAARLFALSRGNASHCMLLARHLVETKAIQYADGSWSLPMDLPEGGLPTSLMDGWLGERSRLTPGAQHLLSALSVPDHGEITLEQCCAAAVRDCDEIRNDLEELCERGFVTASPRGLFYVQAELRGVIYAELSDSFRRCTHERIAAVLEASAGDDPGRQLRASLHWLRAGRVDRGEPLLLSAASAHTQNPTERLRDPAPLYAEAVRCLREAGRDDHAVLLPLAALSAAGFYVDRHYAEKYGEQTVEALRAALKLDLALKLRPWLGRKLSLMIALIAAGVSLRLKRHAPELPHLVYCLLVACTTLLGTATVCLDPERGRRLNDAIEPLTALGSQHAASLIHRFNAALVLSIEDHPARSIRELQSAIDWLRAPESIEGLDAPTRQRYLSGALYARGIKEAFCVDGSSLRTADELQSFGRVKAMQADHLRALHHAYRGERVEADEYFRRVEMGAIQLGTAWQAETWGAAMINNAFWAFDTVALKGAAQRLGQLALELPAIRYYEALARASHLLLHGRAAQALEVLEASDIPPMSRLAWSHARGVFACAHNMLGNHARALELCEEVYRDKSEEEQKVVSLMIVVRVEAAKARAGLGDRDAAIEMFEAVIDECGTRHGPLLAGYVHRARAEVALLMNDPDACEVHIECARRAWQPTGILSALEAVDALAFKLEKARVGDGATSTPVLPDDGHMATRMQIVLESGVGTPLERISAALRVACEGTGAVSGLIVLPEEEIAHISNDGNEPDPTVVQWAQDELRRAREQEDGPTQLLPVNPEDARTVPSDGRLKQVEDREYMWIPLWDSRSRLDCVVGALVLGFDGLSPNRPTGSAWRFVSEDLASSCVTVSESRRRGPAE